MSKYEIYFEKEDDDDYKVLGECPSDDCFVFVEFMNREQLNNFRNMIHNLLLDLNKEFYCNHEVAPYQSTNLRMKCRNCGEYY